MKTTTTLLEDDRARLDIEVPADRLAHDIEHTLHHLAQSVRVPGFRPGKAPPRVVAQRLGRNEVLDETLREHLMRWYVDAVETQALRPVGRPEVDWERLPDEGEPFRFTATVSLRPKGTLPDPLVLEAPRAEASVPSDEVDAELEALRRDSSPLRSVDGRPAAPGDFVTLSFSATVDGRSAPGTIAQGYHAQLGSGRLIPEIDDAVRGMRAGERKDVTVGLPEEHPNRNLAGKDAIFDVLVEGLEERDLRPLDDAFARDASEFDTLAALRTDIESTLGDRLQQEIDAAYRTEVLGALGRVVEVGLPEPVVDEAVDELLLTLARRFERSGIPFQAWLERTGQSIDQVRAELRGEAVDNLRREIGLEALAERDGIALDDAQLEQLVREDLEGEEDAEATLQEVLASPAKERLREDFRLRTALDRAVELATPITHEQAAARESLWTPEKGESSQPKPQLWTPGQPR